MQIYDPADIGRPMAQYSHVTRMSGGDTLYLAGQLAIAREFLIEVQTLAAVPSAAPADKAPAKRASRAGAGRRTR